MTDEGHPDFGVTGCTLCRRWNQRTEPISGCPGDMRCIDRTACDNARYQAIHERAIALVINRIGIERVVSDERAS